METKWTPGPWSIARKGDNIEVGKGIWFDDEQAFEDWQIATFWDGYDEQSANARLSVASPELYEALEACVDAISTLLERTTDPAGRAIAAMNMGDVVLRKARGE